jgi:peptidoglycan L-alanyl-D-glutamate endopeptidase CwlK
LIDMTLQEVLQKAERKLGGLNPIVANAARQLVANCYNRGVLVCITQGYRSIAEQNALYAQGRTKPGKVVTWAKGGTSYHNYGLAIDFALYTPDGRQVVWDEKVDYDGDKVADWMEVIQEAKKLGFTCGIDWIGKKNDPPHLQMTFGLKIAALMNGKKPPTQVTTPVQVASVVSVAKDKCLIEVNGRLLSAIGVMRDGKAYLPVRACGNSAGVTVGFENGKATLGKGVLQTTIIIGGDGYAWAREIANVLGYTIEWNETARTVALTKGAR